MKNKNIFLIGALAVAGFFGLKSITASNNVEPFSDGSSGGGAMSPSAGTTNVYIQAPTLGGSSDSSAQAQPSATDLKSTNQKLASVNRALAEKSGATGGYSTNFGEVYTKNGKVIGGTNVNTGQSLSAQGVAQAQNTWSNLAQNVANSTTKKEKKAEAQKSGA